MNVHVNMVYLGVCLYGVVRPLFVYMYVMYNASPGVYMYMALQGPSMYTYVMF